MFTFFSVVLRHSLVVRYRSAYNHHQYQPFFSLLSSPAHFDDIVFSSFKHQMSFSSPRYSARLNVYLHLKLKFPPRTVRTMSLDIVLGVSGFLVAIVVILPVLMSIFASSSMWKWVEFAFWHHQKVSKDQLEENCEFSHRSSPPSLQSCSSFFQEREFSSLSQMSTA